MRTLAVDCLGLDPDAVYDGLQRAQGTLYIYSEAALDLANIIGTVHEAQRTKGGLTVQVEFLPNVSPIWEHVPALHTAPIGTQSRGRIQVLGLSIHPGFIQ